MRKILYFSGTRADFGLMRKTLCTVRDDPGLRLGIVVTGMHLSEKYGQTERDIAAAGLAIEGRIPVDLTETTGAIMATNLGRMLMGFTEHCARDRPDIVLLLGDRGEMLAGALAALHLGIPVMHIHGGDLSGTIDEPMRHATSKLSHYHCVTTPAARERLIRMGELPDRVFVTGAPGVEDIVDLAVHRRPALCAELGLDPARPTAMFVLHPVVQEAESSGAVAGALLDLLIERDLQIVAVRANSDAGGDAISAELDARLDYPALKVVAHFDRARFVSWMAAADLMIGNTSAGIIEAASFGTPVINVGSRQNLRERNANVIDVGLDAGVLVDAIDRSLAQGRYPAENLYHQPDTAQKIARLLNSVSLDRSILNKINSY